VVGAAVLLFLLLLAAAIVNITIINRHIRFVSVSVSNRMSDTPSTAQWSLYVPPV